MVLIGARAEKINQRQWRRLATLSARFLDSLQGLTTLKMFNATRREAEIIARTTDNYRQTTVLILREAFLSALMLEFFATISVALVAVIIGFKLLYGILDFQAGFLSCCWPWNFTCLCGPWVPIIIPGWRRWPRPRACWRF